MKIIDKFPEFVFINSNVHNFEQLNDCETKTENIGMCESWTHVLMDSSNVLISWLVVYRSIDHR